MNKALNYKLMGLGHKKFLQKKFSSPTFRKTLLKEALELKKNLEKEWGKLGVMTGRERLIITNLAQIAEKTINQVMQVELILKKQQFIHKKYFLYRHLFRKEMLLAVSFLRMIDKTDNTKYILLSDGLPISHGNKVRGFLSSYCDSGLKEFKEIQRGSFIQKIIDFCTTELQLKPQKGTGIKMRIDYFSTDIDNELMMKRI